MCLSCYVHLWSWYILGSCWHVYYMYFSGSLRLWSSCSQICSFDGRTAKEESGVIAAFVYHLPWPDLTWFLVCNFRVVFRLFQSESSAKPFIWKLGLFTRKFGFIYMWIKLSNFHMKSFLLGFALKKRRKTTWESPIECTLFFHNICQSVCKFACLPAFLLRSCFPPAFLRSCLPAC